jgi:hypothetical protein
VNSHARSFSAITLVQSDGNTKPIVIAENVDTSLGKITIQLPRTLIPSNACKYIDIAVEAVNF